MGTHRVFRARRSLVGAALVLAALLGWAGVTAAEQRLALARLTTDPAHDVRPAWSPDGRRIAFQSSRGGRYQIWTINADGSDERRLSHSQMDERHPAWSPDGRWLAFDAGDAEVREIWIMDAEGRDRRQVTRLGAFASFPSWSPDGRRLAFFVYQDGMMDLWSVSVDGVAPRPLTSGLADQRRSECTFSCHAPAWSPDGTLLAVSGGDHRTVWTLPLDGGSPFQVTSGEEHAHFPWFLSDGRLAYVEEHVTSSEAWTEVWAIDLSGRRPAERLLEKVRIQGPYELSPDGERLLFHSPRAGNFDIYVADLGIPEGLAAVQTARAPATDAPGTRAQPTPAAGQEVAGAAAAAPRAEGPVAGAAVDPGRVLLVLAGGLTLGLLGITMWQAARRRARRR